MDKSICRFFTGSCPNLVFFITGAIVTPALNPFAAPEAVPVTPTGAILTGALEAEEVKSAFDRKVFIFGLP